MCMLEFSKVAMHDFHYDHIKNLYGNKSRLLFPGIDSLMYEIETENLYDGFSKNKEMFGFSDYSAKSIYYNDSKPLVVGNIKDEMGDIAAEEFVELKPKMNSILVSNSSEHKKQNV